MIFLPCFLLFFLSRIIISKYSVNWMYCNKPYKWNILSYITIIVWSNKHTQLLKCWRKRLLKINHDGDNRHLFSSCYSFLVSIICLASFHGKLFIYCLFWLFYSFFHLFLTGLLYKSLNGKKLFFHAPFGLFSAHFLKFKCNTKQAGAESPYNGG